MQIKDIETRVGQIDTDNKKDKRDIMDFIFSVKRYKSEKNRTENYR